MSYSVIRTGRNNLRQSEAIFSNLSRQEQRDNAIEDRMEAANDQQEKEQQGQLIGMAINSPVGKKAIGAIGDSVAGAFTTPNAAPVAEAITTMPGSVGMSGAQAGIEAGMAAEAAAIDAGLSATAATEAGMAATAGTSTAAGAGAAGAGGASAAAGPLAALGPAGWAALAGIAAISLFS